MVSLNVPASPPSALAPLSPTTSTANKLAVGSYQLGTSGTVTANSANFNYLIELTAGVNLAYGTNFTGITENRDPSQVMQYTSRYFAALSEAIMANKGTVDKFVGDMVMALFGAPLDDPLHADHAVEAALDIPERQSTQFG